MTRLAGPFNSGAAAGGAGVATANLTSTIRVKGKVLAVGVEYLDSPPAGTTDVTIATSGSIGPTQTILTLTNAATDGWFYPRTPAQDPTGTDVTYDATNEIYIPFAIDDTITITIAQANNDDNVNVWLILE